MIANEPKHCLFLRFRNSDGTWVPLHLMCIVGARRWSACKPQRDLRCRRRPPPAFFLFFPPLCLLAESWSAGDILQRVAPLFFWVACAWSCSRFLCASHALLTLVNYTSRRSAATGGDDIFHTKGLICNLSCRNKAVRINNIPLINLLASGVWPRGLDVPLGSHGAFWGEGVCVRGWFKDGRGWVGEGWGLGGQMYKNRSLSFFSVWDKLEFAMI